MFASADGSVVVFMADIGLPAAAMWTSEGGPSQLRDGSEPDIVSGLSADGRIAVGEGRIGTPRDTLVGAIRWDDGIASEIVDSSGTFDLRVGRAVDISPDGRVIVGYAPSGFRWEDGEAKPYAAGKVAASGWVIVSGGLYDPANGLRSLAEVFAGYGLDLTGWTGLSGRALSDDGRTIVGNGINPDGNPEGFVAVLPPACSDGLDNDGDGQVDHPEDPGCTHPFGREDPQCDDGRDNDGDGRADWDGAGLGSSDPDCSGPTANIETRCGGGFGIAFLLPPLLVASRARRNQRNAPV